MCTSIDQASSLLHSESVVTSAAFNSIWDSCRCNNVLYMRGVPEDDEEMK